MSAAFVWPLLMAASLIGVYRVREARVGPWFSTAVFALGALSGALAVLS